MITWFKLLAPKIEKMESQISILVNKNSKIPAKVKKIAEKFQAGLPKTEFPLKTIEELDDIEAKVTASQEKEVNFNFEIPSQLI